jgi:hypothetical protein
MLLFYLNRIFSTYPLNLSSSSSTHLSASAKSMNALLYQTTCKVCKSDIQLRVPHCPPFFIIYYVSLYNLQGEYVGISNVPLFSNWRIIGAHDLHNLSCSASTICFVSVRYNTCKILSALVKTKIGYPVILQQSILSSSPQLLVSVCFYHFPHHAFFELQSTTCFHRVLFWNRGLS